MINTDLLIAVTLGIFLASIIQTTVNYGIGKITYKKRRALLDKEYNDFRKRMSEITDVLPEKEETK
jgi:hypothetical protein